MKSWKKPTTKEVDKVVALLAHAEQYRYFFDKLNNPFWIAPLVEKGYFQTPPRIVENDDKGSVRFPPWPDSKLLLRMSEYEGAHKDIADIISKIDTDNISVIGDFLDCLVKMPRGLIQSLVPKVKKWINSPIYWLLPEKYAFLIIHLADIGCAKEAISLSRSLLSVKPDPRYKGKAEGKYSFPPDIVAKFQDYDYEEVLQKLTLPLAQKAGIEALEMYADILSVSINLSMFNPEESKPEDVSYIWRPAIEDNEQNHGENIKNSLITALRNTIKIISETSSSDTKKVIELLQKRDWKIFHRLLLFSLDNIPEFNDKLLLDECINESNFLDPSLRHEYFFLLKNHFSKLPKDKQKILLNWISKGPQVNDYKKYFKQVSGEKASDSDVKKYIDHWKLSKYYPIADSLEREHKEAYELLLKELGEPKHPSFTSYSETSTWGPLSPKNADELLALDQKKLVLFLKEWEPLHELHNPSREGFGREITAAIASKPEYFDPIIVNFIGLHPTYVRALLTGYRDLARNKKKIPWRSLFTLIDWVLKQKYDPDTQEKALDEDVGWGWTRNSIVELLGAGFENNAYQIEFVDRTRAWDILYPFTEDPDPSKEREAKKDNLDPASLSINSTRGEAMHAVIKYALWVRRNLEKIKSEIIINEKGFENMHEVKAVLNTHLDLNKEESVAVRAVYGQWLPWLILLDRNWVQDKLKVIFPEQEKYKDLYDAAWDTYISLCSPYKNVISILYHQYELAIRNLANPDTKKNIPHLRGNLVQHLAVYYWIGKIELKEGSLLSLFFKTANAKQRTELIEFIGRSLQDTKEEIPPVVLNRLKALWDSRRLAINTEKGFDELVGFGWWFVSKKFDKDWAIDQLLYTLKLTKKINPDHKISEIFEEFTVEYPKEISQCLLLMIEGEKEGWGLLDWGKELRKILITILSSKNKEAIGLANQIINDLGKRGLLDYGDLAS